MAVRSYWRDELSCCSLYLLLCLSVSRQAGREAVSRPVSQSQSRRQAVSPVSRLVNGPAGRSARAQVSQSVGPRARVCVRRSVAESVSQSDAQAGVSQSVSSHSRLSVSQSGSQSDTKSVRSSVGQSPVSQSTHAPGQSVRQSVSLQSGLRIFITFWLPHSI